MVVYFNVIVDVSDLFVIFYNVLGCIVVDMLFELVVKLVMYKNIVGFKDVIGNIVCFKVI